MKLFRKTVFWLHLVAGLVAGTTIAVMSFTGGVLAFEHEIVGWAERDFRQVKVSAEASRLPLTELRSAFAEIYPDKTLAQITVSSDPRQAVELRVGRRESYFANPYTGEIMAPDSAAIRGFMSANLRWHRWLAQEGDNRSLGAAITGASNFAFVVLAITGLYLWWPAAWRWPVLRRSLAFIHNSSAKARDWNWHNAIGFWFLVPILAMSVTGVFLSYTWAADLVYKATGEEIPQQRGRQTVDLSDVTFERPAQRTRPADIDRRLASVTAALPAWDTITLPLSSGRGRGGHSHGGHGRGHGHSHGSEARSGSGGSGSPAAGQQRGSNPVVVEAKLADRWPRTATTSVVLNPFNAEVLKIVGFEDRSAGGKIRGWIRHLHTGAALGWPGKLIGALGCIGGCFLVYTGFALSWRRFFPGTKPPSAAQQRHRINQAKEPQSEPNIAWRRSKFTRLT